MLIVLTSEKEIVNEAALINQLFEAGLHRLHLRKPQFTKSEYSKLLDQIEPQHYKKIMLHEYHDLVNAYDLRGMHLQEKARRDLKRNLENFLAINEKSGYKVSSSFHTVEEIKDCGGLFEYVLLSPVFSSISKLGYKGKNFDVNGVDEYVIGMGGINQDTLQATYDLGYQGVGVLGGVWNTTKPLESFKAIKSSYDAIFQNAIT
ncbi:thiamine phosphate synthase [Aquimarina brevivitae]|uniref:Thiamine-phosphate pyrophosphorylase n=1 Tax=Aquimarina brevivitae TaxID=323412 RepID=A0A4Q7PGG2_9FLAO|nr:thiamine phosphate synthase [Aquimarina brevivitae]RZS99604.1 thiamine-phosphate pyrophosphorylase [Aquimarina brevivitae]